MENLLLNAIVRFAETSDSVTALILIGSRARIAMKADAYSDIDLVLVVKDAQPFLSGDEWLKAIAPYHISFTEPTLEGQAERRVLFAGAQDVDFVIVNESAAEKTLDSGIAADIFARGARMLVNKQNLSLPPSPPEARPAFAAAGEAEFVNLVQDFWFHAIWTAKKLLRGEIWTAKNCADAYMKRKLLWMIEQHAHAARHTDRDTWYAGRFIERWADADVLEYLRTTYAHFDLPDIARALQETMELFRRLAKETAEALGYAYPADADAYAADWVRKKLAPPLPESLRKGTV